MAHFAKIGLNSKVLQVLALDNDKMLNADGVEDESVGQQWLERHNNWPAQMWVQTSRNTYGNQHQDGGTPLRGNYAGIGYTWDEDDQIFWPKKPHASWVKNTTTAQWDAPIAKPDLTAEQESQNEANTHDWNYLWNEEGQSWDLTDLKA